MISRDRRAMAHYARMGTLLNAAVGDGSEINLEEQERLADQMRYEITSWLDFVRVSTEPSVTQPALDLGDWKAHACDSARCCDRGVSA